MEFIKAEEITPDERRLAELLHDFRCHSNHTDQCGWLYETWDNPAWSKTRWVESARALIDAADIQGIPLDTVNRVISLIRLTRTL